MVKTVRESWTRDRNAIDAGIYVKSALEGGADVYSNGGEIVMIEAPAGFGGEACARTFEYEGGKLIFAFYTGEGQEYRMYFHNDTMFRLDSRVHGSRSVLDAAYEDQDFRQWHGAALSQGYELYRMAGGAGGAEAAVTQTGQTDFILRTEYRNSLGNGEEYLMATFGETEDVFVGTQGEVTDTNWYTYSDPWFSFSMSRSANMVYEMFGNAGTLFELSRDSYTMEEVAACLGAFQNNSVYDGESVEGSFAQTGEKAFYCENEYYAYTFILVDGKVTRDSRANVSFSPYLCLY